MNFKEVIKNYLIDILLILFSITPSIYSLYLDMNGSEGMWFQRSGSLMVLFAVLLELNLLKFKDIERASSVFIEGKPAMKSADLPPLKKKMQVLAFLLAATGTFIWGYGDLPFK